MTAQGAKITPDWLRPAAMATAVLLHAGVVLGLPWPAAHDQVVTAPLAIEVVAQGAPVASMETPNPAAAADVRPAAAESVDSVAAESKTLEQIKPDRPEELAEARPTEAKPVEMQRMILLTLVATDMTPPPRDEATEKPEQPAPNVEPKRDRTSKKEKTQPRSSASTASSANSGARFSSVAAASGASARADYRSLVAAELNRRKFYPPAARDAGARGDVIVSFGALDGAVNQMMRSVSFPPPPGGSFHVTAPIHFDIPR